MTDDSNDGNGTLSEEEREAVNKFTELVCDNMPEAMSTNDIIRLCGHFLTSYSPGPAEAANALAGLTMALKGFYEDNSECDCPECRAKRNIQ